MFEFITQPSFHAVQKDIANHKTPGSQYTTKTTHYNNNQNGTAGNLSELDTLLQDLSAARYSSNLGGGVKSSHGSQNALNDSIKRPSVDDLLEELSNAQGAGPVYAVPNRYVFKLICVSPVKYNKY